MAEGYREWMARLGIARIERRPSVHVGEEWHIETKDGWHVLIVDRMAGHSVLPMVQSMFEQILSTHYVRASGETEG